MGHHEIDLRDNDLKAELGFGWVIHEANFFQTSKLTRNIGQIIFFCSSNIQNVILTISTDKNSPRRARTTINHRQSIATSRTRSGPALKASLG